MILSVVFPLSLLCLACSSMLRMVWDRLPWKHCSALCLSVCLSVGLSVCLSVCLLVCFVVCSSVCLTVCLSVCVSFGLCECLSVCVFVCSGSVLAVFFLHSGFFSSSYSPRWIHVGAVLGGVVPVVFSVMFLCHVWPFVLQSWTGALV